MTSLQYIPSSYGKIYQEIRQSIGDEYKLMKGVQIQMIEKNKEWAKKEVDKYFSYKGVIEARNALVFTKGVIDQLDEPETLSQKWIDENQELQFYEANDTADYFVRSTHLQNLLVPKQETEKVNHPQHYQSDKIEVIDIIEAFDLNFHLGNVVKYVLRSNSKGNYIEDLQKAKWYLERELEKYG